MFTVDWLNFSKNYRLFVKNEGPEDVTDIVNYYNKDNGKKLTIRGTRFSDFQTDGERHRWVIPGNSTYQYCEWYCNNWYKRCEKLFVLTKYCEALNIPLKIRFGSEHRVPLTTKTGKIYACYL